MYSIIVWEGIQPECHIVHPFDYEPVRKSFKWQLIYYCSDMLLDCLYGSLYCQRMLVSACYVYVYVRVCKMFELPVDIYVLYLKATPVVYVYDLSNGHGNVVDFHS